MAKAGLLFVGTDDGLVLFSNPGAVGRWLRVGQALRGHVVRAIWPVADNPLIVLAAGAEMGVQRSDDGGQSWRKTFEADATVVVGHHADAALVYLGTADGGVYRSADAGASWEVCPQGARPSNGGPACLIVAYDDPRQLYLGLGAGGVWLGDDSGAQWVRYGVDAPAGIAALADTPGQPCLLYAVAESELYRCRGAEERWERVAGGQADASAALAVLAGKEPVLLVAIGGAPARSADGGATWAPSGGDVAWSGGVTALAPARYHMDTAFGGSGGGQLAQSSDRGRTWQLLKQDLAPIRSIAAARLA